MSIGVFTAMSDQLQTDLINKFIEKISAMIHFAQPIATLSFLLFITFYGYMILMGKVQAPAKEFLWRVGIIVLVFTVAFSETVYERFISGPVVHATRVITQITTEESRQDDKWWEVRRTNFDASHEVLIKNTNSYLAGLDIVFESVNVITTGMMEALQVIKKLDKKSEAGSQSQPQVGVPEMMMMGTIGTILTGAVMVYVTAGATLLLNHIFLVVLLTLGPIFLALAAFKITRDYAKKWLVKLITIALTLALVTAMLGFVLKMQGTFSGQLCRVVSEVETQMKKNYGTGEGEIPADIKWELDEIKAAVTRRLTAMHAMALNFDAGLSTLRPDSPNQLLVSDIKIGCSRGAVQQGGSSNNTNLLFVAMQYLVICMLFNRLITEMSSLASSIVGASGINTGSAQEVSGGVGGVAQRGGLKGRGAPSRPGVNQ